ncbi:uncharacterized protein EDB91DRAFT_1078468 [Suillus paluster]|uniref:uncharacterized protein n=1 Tax=Suillus paluster TaxID=48578 RepID=UPI001B866ACC|nr:uncharacterized protein EDB91DRAFT_1078468 [Suillus paluster]KAG1750430.1 hypothetical protein EDB91DRAFT_1078468 [Suillus paluster]
MPPRRQGQKSQVTTVPPHAAVTPTAAAPIDATPIVTPIAAAIAPIAATVAPIAAAVALNATMLQHPQRQWQLPLRFRNNSPVRTGTSRTLDDGEYIDISNVSGDEEDNLPAPSIRASPVPSPLQTVTSTIYSTQVDPLATGKIQLLNARFAEFARWTLAAICERLWDPVYHIESLGTIPNQGHGNFPPGTTLSLDDYIPDFSIDEMHRQLVKFIVADDQAS